ncbi:glycosyltransferase [Paenibacillus sp. ACRRX]|uniref:glycosyltransferase n=1 Tax=Paenibacillus sp. ACRRX TaxID=2918206 RepID=UPI001EF68C8A|nr:glycosyltransferase [Paenibacillus sp. ACRRX]
MIVKNEEDMLEECLLSILDVVSEVVIGDTGSTDNTQKIALRYGISTIPLLWEGCFATARNAVIDNATQPYVLIMDADERLNEGSADALREYIQMGTNSVGKVIIQNVKEDNSVILSQITRLFPNNSNYRFEGKIHEQLKFDGRSPIAVTTSVNLMHLGYMESAIKHRGKLERNLLMLSEVESQEPANSYIQFQLGQTYFVGKEYDKAVQHLIKAIQLVPEHEQKSIAFLSNAWLSLCYSLLYLEQYDAVLKNIPDAIQLYPEYTDLYFVYGLTLTSMKHPSALELIPDVFQQCLELGEADPNIYETSRGVGSFKAHYNLGVYWEIFGNLTRAQHHYKSAAMAGYQMAADRLASISQ